MHLKTQAGKGFRDLFNMTPNFLNSIFENGFLTIFSCVKTMQLR